MTQFEWDEVKARRNLMKHGMEFAEAVGVFDDPLALTLPDPHPTEPRFVTIGRDLLDRIVVVSWTWRDENIRLISVRHATPSERRSYQERKDDA